MDRTVQPLVREDDRAVGRLTPARMHGELLTLRERMDPWKDETFGRALDELLNGITLPIPGTRPTEESL